MLQEILGCFVSLFTMLTSDTPRVTRELNANPDRGSSELFEESIWENKIHKEYDTFEQDDFESQAEYVRFGYESRDKRTYVQSILRSLKATFGITLATIPLVLMGMGLIYFDLRTCDLCSEWLQAGNYGNFTLPFDVMRIRLLGDIFEVIVCNLWFPMNLIVLFGWSEFKLHYSSTLFLCVVSGLLTSLYFSFLLLYGAYNHQSPCRVPGDIAYAIALLCGCFIVVRKIRKNYPRVSYSRLHILSLISVPLMCCFSMGIFYRYAIVKWFNSLDNDMYKFMVAVSTPTIALVPTAICKNMALRRTAEIIEPERSFALVYFVRAGWIILYRIMQADFKSIWMFAGLSLLSSVAGMIKLVTVGIRERMWTRIIKLLRKTCCSRLRQLPGNSPHRRRLQADMEIQSMIFENSSLVVSQAYIVFYMITSYEISDWDFLNESLMRIAIGIGIELFFNFLSILVRVHWHNIPIARVWSKSWKQHMFANGVFMAILVCYFTELILAVFQDQMNGSSEDVQYTIRNCTLPYENWR